MTLVTHHAQSVLHNKDANLHKNNYHAVHPYVQNKKLALSENDSTEPWSNAFNFKKTWGTQTDPRTGILSAFVKTGSLISNFGHGPDIDLEINYSSGNIANVDKLGLGWSWNLSNFNSQSNQLTTSGGQNFHLQQNGYGQWKPLYHKLNDINIQGDKNTHFVITLANGLREILNHDGYEVRLEQQDGWGVNFLYAHGTNRLQAITDDTKHKITIIYKEGCFMVISSGTDGQPVKVHINNSNNQLSDIMFPLKNDSMGKSIHINYTRHLINQITYPTGLKEIVKYNCTNAIKFSSGYEKSNNALCVVFSETVNIGADHPDMTTYYEYSKANANEHDYLAYNSGLTLIRGSNKDILFEAPNDYTYRTQQDNGLTREIRTYNKYHLMIDDKKISDHTEYTLSEAQFFYCRTDRLDGCAQTSFDDLPVTYSLPLKTVTKVMGVSSGIPAVSTVTRMYDNQGRVTNVSNDYGITTKTVYCPAKGDAACPAVPEDWSFSTLPKSITVYPSKIAVKEMALPEVITKNYYRAEPNHTGKGYILVLDHQIHQVETQQRIITKQYYHDPANILTYGLLKKTILTGTMQKTAISGTVIEDYRYIKSADGHSKTVYNDIELGQDKFLPLSNVTTSIFTNQVLKQTDPSGKNMTCYYYDLWGRVIQVNLAVGTSFAASTYYQYIISPIRNEALITTINGLQRKIIFDSAGRKLMTFSEVIDSTGKAKLGQWLPKDKISYDNYGRIARQYVYISDESGKTQSLMTAYHYDDMNMIRSVDMPDNETIIKQYDDFYHCMISYKQNRYKKHSTISVSVYNRMDEPVQQIILPALQGDLPSHKALCTQGSTLKGALVSFNTYDGFGREITTSDPLGRTTSNHYNALGQITEVTNSTGDTIHPVYNFNGQVIQTWMLPVSGGKYLLSSSEYNAAGQQLWKTGEDGKPTLYTYTHDGKLETITTSSNHIVRWKYNILGFPVAEYLDGKLQLQTDYNPLTLLPVKKRDSTGVTTWTYSDDGLLQKEVHLGQNKYPNYQLQWQYDKNRRTINTTDITNNKSLVKYDALGRVSALYYQSSAGSAKLLSAFVYDSFSRVNGIHYGSDMQKIIAYDVYGQQRQVRDTLHGNLLSQWNYIYDADGNITQLEQQSDDSKKAVINYQYDRRNNLISMICHGSANLPLCPHDTAVAGSGLNSAPIIIRQDYTFNALNRLAQVKEELQNSANTETISKVINYKYGDISAPLRLHNISVQWNKKVISQRYFSYDLLGNMLIDGEGNQISYNSFNQVTRVITPEGISSSYAYDGRGKEVMQKTHSNIHYLFYRDNTLINESIYTQGEITHTTGYYGVARTMDGVIDQYYENNYKGDISGILTQNPQNNQYQLSRRNIYSPYGMSWHKASSLSSLKLYQKPLTGFNGERTDPVTDWLFLGAGHRTYNPKQRYFMSEDPAGDGYSFCSNNPVMNTDPSGNMPKWLGKAFTGINYITTFGLAAVHKQWASITASVILAGLTIAGAGFAVVSNGSTLAVTAASITATLSTVPVVAAVIPPNKGMNIAAAISGGVIMAIGIASGISLLGSSIFNTTLFAAPEEFSEFSESSEYSISSFTTTSSDQEINRTETILGAELLDINGNLPLVTLVVRGIPTDYLAVNSNEAIENAAVALRTARPRTADDYVGALIIAAKIKGQSVNLNHVEYYLDTLETINNIPGMTPRLYLSVINRARVRLFEEINEYQDITDFFMRQFRRVDIGNNSDGTTRAIVKIYCRTVSVVYSSENIPYDEKRVFAILSMNLQTQTQPSIGMMIRTRPLIMRRSKISGFVIF